MVLFDRVRENADAIREVGRRAIEDAKRMGLPAHYMDPSLGDGIIRELPDGTRQRLERQDGEDVVVEQHGPRA